MSTNYEPAEIEHVIAELETDNARAAIIVGGSLIEHGLERLIKSSLRAPESRADIEALSSDTGLLGTFSNKITTAYFMRLIGPSTQRDCHLIRKIRNEVAHNMNPLSFETPEIANRCLQLEFAKRSIAGQTTPPDLRGKFLFTVHFFTAALLLKAGESALPLDDGAQTIYKYVEL
jgi:hypothetical protein